VIKFCCPNGHPLAAPANRAGKSGQCPRCQAQFVVPEATDTAGDDAVATATDASERNDELPSRDAAATARFMFLCPNGHKLFGPPSLQGRPGQCPHCNSRFLIPDDREEAVPDDIDPPFSRLGNLSDLTSDMLPDNDVGFDPGDDSASVSIPEDPPPVPVSCHPLTQVIRRIQAETRGAGQLDVRLRGGTTLAAVSLSADLSQHEYGVFAVRGADHASSSIVVVPWDQVTRITISQLSDLPSDLRPVSAATPPRPDRPR
jgi:hypothetical protein